MFVGGESSAFGYAHKYKNIAEEKCTNVKIFHPIVVGGKSKFIARFMFGIEYIDFIIIIRYSIDIERKKA